MAARTRLGLEGGMLVTNPIPLKAALEMTGLIPLGGLRLPLFELDADRRATVREALDAAGVAVS